MERLTEMSVCYAKYYKRPFYQLYSFKPHSSSLSLEYSTYRIKLTSKSVLSASIK